MGSFDVLLGPAPFRLSFSKPKTIRLLILSSVCMARPLVFNIVRSIWKFIVCSRAFLVLRLCYSNKKSIASFLYFSFHSNSKYWQHGAKRNQYMTPKVCNKISFNIPRISMRVLIKLELLVISIPITIQCLVKEVILPLDLGLVSN